MHSRRHLRPLALEIRSISEFIEHIVYHCSARTTLIICSSRESCMEEILAAIPSPRDEDTEGNNDSEESTHTLLTPTLYTIAMTASLDLVFTSTLPQLRAYLSNCQPKKTSQIDSTRLESPGRRSPILAILGLASLHRSTAEHSTQGLSRTISSAAETAYHTRRRLILAEPSLPKPQEGNGVSAEYVSNPWKEQISLLSDSIRVSSGQRMFAGRSVELGAVVGKWCRFAQTYM